MILLLGKPGQNLFCLFTVLCSVLLYSVIVAFCTFFNNDSQWRTQKISEGGQSFVTIVWRHKSTLGEVPKARPF